MLTTTTFAAAFSPREFRVAVAALGHSQKEDNTPRECRVLLHSNRDSQALVLLLHGSESHSGWFTDVAGKLAGRGLSVATYDRRGWGQSPGPRGVLRRPEDAFAELDAVVAELMRQTNCRDIHLAGMSWGGLLAAAWLNARSAQGGMLSSGQRVASLTLIAPGIRSISDITAVDKIRTLRWACLGTDSSVKLPMKSCDFSSNKSTQTFIDTDPARVTSVSASFCFSTWLMRRGLATQSAKRFLATQNLHVILAGNDSIIDNKLTSSYFEDVGGAKMTTIAGADHAIVLERSTDVAAGIAETIARAEHGRRNATLHFESIELFDVATPMRLTFRHAAAARKNAQRILIRLTSRTGDNRRFQTLGEVLPRDYVTGETFSGARKIIAGELWPKLRELVLSPATPPATSLASLHASADTGMALAAWAGLDVAATTAWMKAFGQGAAALPVPPGLQPGDAHLRADSRSNPATTTGPIGISNGLVTTVICLAFRLAGFTDFKMKIDGRAHTSDDVMRRVRLVRWLIGDKATLRVDANGSLSPEILRAIAPDLQSLGVISIEEPFPRGRQADMRAMAAELKGTIRIVADESLCTLNDARQLTGPNIGWNLRLGKNGGFTGIAALLEISNKTGVPVQLGCLVGESEILEAAAGSIRHWAPWQHRESSFPGLLLAENPLKALPPATSTSQP